MNRDLPTATLHPGLFPELQHLKKTFVSFLVATLLQLISKAHKLQKSHHTIGIHDLLTIRLAFTTCSPYHWHLRPAHHTIGIYDLLTIPLAFTTCSTGAHQLLKA
jgi:hypothetical protein